MVQKLCSMAKGRVIISFAPDTWYYTLLKKVMTAFWYGITVTPPSYCVSVIWSCVTNGVYVVCLHRFHRLHGENCRWTLAVASAVGMENCRVRSCTDCRCGRLSCPLLYWLMPVSFDLLHIYCSTCQRGWPWSTTKTKVKSHANWGRRQVGGGLL